MNKFFLFSLFFIGSLFSQNQTDTLSPVTDSTNIPYNITIEQASFTLPTGIQSYAFAPYKQYVLFIAGRTNGLHGFSTDDFPPSLQNRSVYVLNLDTGITYSRSLDEVGSGLTQEIVDTLSVTSPQYFHTDTTLYVSGGYGIDRSTGLFSTKDTLTAIDLHKAIKWVTNQFSKKTFASCMRQTSNPLLQVTGGYMRSTDSRLSSLLIFGQNFVGTYNVNSNGLYTQQVRPFQIIDNGKNLSVQFRKAEPANPNYRRRDLNVVPIVFQGQPIFVALSGVFLPGSAGGIWTVPVLIYPDGSTFMPDPSEDSTFKQAMNNYFSPSLSFYDSSNKKNYITLMGGITYGYFDDSNTFQTDAEFPFTNQMTTLEIDKEGNTSQHLMPNQYPTITVDRGGSTYTLLFGAGAPFIYSESLHRYTNGVIPLSKLKKQTTLGHIIGGIMSTLPNTNDRTDSSASPYVFRVIYTPK